MNESGASLKKDSTDLVHLPTVIANEFGISRSVAREQIMLGTVTIDAKPWQGDKIDIPLKALVGRELVVTGRARVFRMIYEVPGYGR